MNLISLMNIPKTIQEWLPTVLIVLILFLLYGVYYLYHRKFKKEGFNHFIREFLIYVTFGGGLVVYCWGYHAGHPYGSLSNFLPNFLESIFSTIRLFILGNDLVEINPEFKHNAMFHAMFSLTASLAAFIFISFMVQVLFKNWVTKSKIKRIKPAENHFFYGINNAALSLSYDLAENNAKRLVVFVNDYCSFDDSQLYSRIHRNAYEVKRKSFSDCINLEKEEGILKLLHKNDNHAKGITCNEELFYNLKVLKKIVGVAETHIYFLTDDDDWNIKHARLAITELDNLIKKMKDKGKISKPIRIHVATWDEISEKYFTVSLVNLPEKISVVVHNYATLISRQLIEMQHPVNFVGINKEQAIATTDFNALIIGFGQIGTHVLRKLIEQGQFVGSTFHATVIDKFVHTHEGRFEHLYPGVMANYDVQFVEAEIGYHVFYKVVKTVIDKTNYIVIALGQDELNIQTALELLEINSIKNQKDLKIFIQLEDESHWKETLQEYKGQIAIFGESDKVFTAQNILQQEVESKARLVHQVYNGFNNSSISFDKLPRHDQLSNVSVAEHIIAKVRLLGFDTIEEFSSKFASNDDYVKWLTKQQIQNLSIGEHLRWNAFHFIHGWTNIPLEKIDGKTVDERYVQRRNNDLKMHACLTTWENLEQLGKLIERDMQEYDTNSVLHLYDFINSHLN